MLRPISIYEVHRALFSMKPFKAPGPDGLQPVFFQRYWNYTSEAVCNIVRNAFSTGLVPEGLNSTLISLIPKVEHPETFSQFRPISLCNVVFTIITKVLVQRIRPLLNGLISPFQSSFVPGRQTTDNIIVLQEAIHSLHRRKGKVGDMIVKLDLEKAYDRMSWFFLEDTLHSMNFPSRWIQLIMRCVTSCQMQILWNGAKSDIFFLSLLEVCVKAIRYPPISLCFVWRDLDCLFNSKSA